MSEKQEIPWKRLAAEASAIVISILLAFAIDAWWDDRGNREAEQLLLQRLRSDFLELQADIRFVEQEHQDASSACITLLNIPYGEAVPESPEIDHMVAIVFLTARTFNPGSGAVDAFLGGAGARLVQNQRLADRILAWPGLVEELQEEEISLQKGVVERWIPFLASRVSLGPYLATYPDLIAEFLPEQAAAPVPRTPLIVDQEFVNQVLDRFKFQRIALRDIAPLREAVDEILALLDSDIRD
jgi:hypothetical protein